MNRALKEQILNELDLLTEPQHRGSVGELVKEFGGIIGTEDLDRMARAVEEGCERIDPD